MPESYLSHRSNYTALLPDTPSSCSSVSSVMIGRVIHRERKSELTEVIRLNTFHLKVKKKNTLRVFGLVSKAEHATPRNE